MTRVNERTASPFLLPSARLRSEKVRSRRATSVLAPVVSPRFTFGFTCFLAQLLRRRGREIVAPVNDRVVTPREESQLIRRTRVLSSLREGRENCAIIDSGANRAMLLALFTRR